MLKLKVPDMSCGHCVDRITKTLGGLGAKVASSDLSAKIVEVDEGSCPKEKILEALDDIGFSATIE